VLPCTLLAEFGYQGRISAAQGESVARICLRSRGRASVGRRRRAQPDGGWLRLAEVTAAGGVVAA
jgi:hypothetical protein